MSVTDAPRLLTLDEVAERLRLSRRTVERLVAAEILPALRVGRRAIRVDEEEFRAWLYDIPPRASHPLSDPHLREGAQGGNGRAMPAAAPPTRPEGEAA